MEPKDIARINELARKARNGGLTEEETAEQARLRRAYVEAVRANLTAQLDSTYIVEPDGTKHRLRPKTKSDDSRG